LAASILEFDQICTNDVEKHFLNKFENINKGLKLIHYCCFKLIGLFDLNDY